MSRNKDCVSQRSEITNRFQAIWANLDNLISDSEKSGMTISERRLALKVSLSQLHLLQLASFNMQYHCSPEILVMREEPIRNVLDDCIRVLDGLATQNGVRLHPVELPSGALANLELPMSRADLSRAILRLFYDVMEVESLAGSKVDQSVFTKFSVERDHVTVTFSDGDHDHLNGNFLDELLNGDEQDSLRYREAQRIIKKHNGILEIKARRLEEQYKDKISNVKITFPRILAAKYTPNERLDYEPALG